MLIPFLLFAQECIIEKVIDGDTLLCSGEKVRLIGIDTPESTMNRRVYKQSEFGSPKEVIALGIKAKRFVMGVVSPGTRVRLEFDIQRRDKYGRLLAYVYLPDGRMLNELILREGYASLLTIPPNVKYTDRFREAFKYARENNKGLWAEAKIRNFPVKRCGDKRYCSQMNSCDEAIFYFRVCGLKRLDGDGDGDGIPCEKLCKP
ncbi:excalibur calcium-binding domain-containing protein [Hydrogenivirga caldilitoris]|uniref:Excalibur calcium-binding domain-containing protein n=2 Tax=Hydrogenivirga caldilitoris TaxID=246264 RepID=A0A497XTT5_9AQUI|nr:excalibur calcium-binding domain-containing protein [Hydrogenivirga caldilitoris]